MSKQITPLNQVIADATKEYLMQLRTDIDDGTRQMPVPTLVESELLDYTNAAIKIENKSRLSIAASDADVDNESKIKGSPEARQLKAMERLTESQLVDIIIALHKPVRIKPTHSSTDSTLDVLALYNESGDNEGIYTSDPTRLHQLCKQYDYSISSKGFEEVVSLLHTMSPRHTVCTDRDLIAVNNGVFNYKTKSLMPFSPDYIFTSKSSVNYNPDATISPLIKNPDGTIWDVDSWLDEVCDDSGIKNLMWQIFSAIIRPHVRWGKAAWFFSEEGNNGKGTLVALMRNLCGEGAWTSIPLAAFAQEFMLESLTDSSAILVDENDVGSFIDKAANLKAVITNDVILLNRKNRRPIAYQFWGFMVQCINGQPRFKDRSDSFYRRQLFIPFTKTFEGVERKYIKDDYIQRTEVLEYILNRALNSNFYEFDQPASVKAALEEYKINNDPIRRFWFEHEDPENGRQFTWDFLPNEFLYEMYKAWYKRDTGSNGQLMSSHVFISGLKHIVSKNPNWSPVENAITVKTNLTKGSANIASEPYAADYRLSDWSSMSVVNGSNTAVGLPKSNKLNARLRGFIRN